METTTKPASQRRLAAIMFADMVSFSALTQRDEALALELVDEQRALMKPILERHDGRLVKTMGDGYLVEFASALDAARCAVEIQRVIAARNARTPEARRMQLRVGVHLGDVVARDGDVLGDGVNIAARIEPKAEPGGVCVSQQIYDQVHNKLAERLTPLGRVELKNIAEPLAVYRIELDASAPAPAAKAARKESLRGVAVLPFSNMSSEAENEFLSDGITEDIISALSRVEGLQVSARTSAFAFKGKNEDARAIGEKLNAAWIVEGSVRKAGNRLRVTAQLSSTKDGFQLWSDRFDREMRDVFAIQDDIARAVVEALKAKLKLGAGAAAARAATTPEAYELYLKGKYHWNQRGLGLRKARHYYELAALEDPRYGPAHAGLAETFALLYFYGAERGRDSATRARDHARAALARDESLAEAYAPLGFISLSYDRDMASAEASLKRARELNPNYAPAHYWLATTYGALGRHDEASREMDRALELDPLSPVALTLAGWLRIFARRYDESEELLRRAASLNGGFMLPYWVLGQTLALQGRFDEAIKSFEKSAELSGRGAWALGGLAWAHGLAGRREDCAAARAELDDRAKREYVSPLIVARALLGAGDAERAAAWLSYAVEEKDSLLAWAGVDPAFETFWGKI